MNAKTSVTFLTGLILTAVLCLLSLPARAEADTGQRAYSLRKSGLHRAALGREDSVQGLSVSQQDAAQNVLALLVDFPADTNSNTTGTGKFDLSTGSDETINPPPHDRGYFQRQLEALRRYYLKVSGGQLDISHTVYPEGSQEAYTLPNEMAYYSPNLTDEENDRRLAELFRDALETADAAGDIDFAQFDAVVIFHAGVGADISFAIDETPNDIPSAFIDLEWLAGFLGSEYAQGVPVNGGAHRVQEGLWMPETLNQQDVEFGLTGLLALLFGHQLGLPNLYSSEDGSSGIGSWGLMDQGSGNELGLIPAQPCAWSRVFLGWETPLVAREDLDVAIDALALEGSNAKVVKVPINAEEYFLIENRQRDVFGDSAVAIVDGGVIIEIDEYDWGIPGSGLLIWHIDEKVIRENYESNAVNADPDHRGVDLEEADGFQDIGFVIYGGYVTYGLPEDAFYQGNNTEFTPDSNPNSSSYTGADSHIFITGIGPSGPTMTCDVSMDLYQPGWPDSVGVSLAENPPLVGDLDGYRDMEIVTNTPDGRVFAWNQDGTPFLPGVDSSALFVQAEDSVAGSATLGDMNFDMIEEIVLIEKDGKVHIWNQNGGELMGFPVSLEIPVSSFLIGSVASQAGPQQWNGEIVVGASDGYVSGHIVSQVSPGESNEWMLERSWRIQLDAVEVTDLAVAELSSEPSSYLVAAGTAGGRVAWFDPYEGIPIEPFTVRLPSPISGLATGDLDRDGSAEIIAVRAEGEVAVWTLDGEPLPGWPVETSGTLGSSPALGDIDSDGYLEIVVAGTDELWAWNYNGSPVSNFPISLRSVGTFRSSPVLGDVDGDGHIDIIVGTPQGLVMAYDRFGKLLDGWPLACAGAVDASLTLADIDGDGDIEILAGDQSGWMYIWDLASEPDPEELPWPTWGHDFRHTGAYPDEDLPPMPPAGDLMPAASVYNYPNPTEGQSTTIRYQLGREAEVEICIYDLSGDLVAEMAGTGFAHTENEVIWDLNGVASGVYFCRVEARGSGGIETVFCKIAVVK
ncbi:FG-GAP-like repeat-containing protein [Candidatus Zixiibacteriota bacterium]